MRLGLDVYSLRSQGWTPFECLDFCAERSLSVVHFSELRFLGGLDRGHLRKVREHAAELGIDLEIGMRSICPSSTIFDAAAGTAQQQIGEAIEAARIIGSPILRCVVGRFVDRFEAGGIERRIRDTVDVIGSVRSMVADAGVRLAVENHGGDLQARELKRLVEDAGPDLVGVCLDSGNPLWAMEDPHLTLQTLAPYVLTSHVRDGVVWHTPAGAAVSWTRMGEGQIGIAEYIGSYLAQCPGRPLSLEIIVSDEPRPLNYRDAEFWRAYDRMPGWELCRFLALADEGAPVEPRAAAGPEERVARELQDVEASIRWTQALLAGGTPQA